jgi:hypothetical protein
MIVSKITYVFVLKLPMLAIQHDNWFGICVEPTVIAPPECRDHIVFDYLLLKSQMICMRFMGSNTLQELVRSWSDKNSVFHQCDFLTSIWACSSHSNVWS